MDNAVDAMIMAFSMIVFLIAFTASMYMFNQVSATSEVLLYVADKSNYFENIELATDTNITTRIVDLETVIPTIYRYYKENFCVKICDGRNNQNELVQIFDVDIEGRTRTAESATELTPAQDALIKAYGNDESPRYLFESPWIGNTETDAKTRIDLYIKGEQGYINNTKVDYTDRTAKIDSLAELKDILEADADQLEIQETFVEYVFSGDTITLEDGDDTERITGDKQESSKIIITYTLKEKA